MADVAMQEKTAREARVGRAGFLAGWAVLTAAQGALAAALWGQGVAVAAAVLAVQAAKAWWATRRLADLGLPPDDTLWSFVPLFNVGLFGRLLAATPPDAARERRLRSWSTQLTAVGAYAEGARMLRAQAGALAGPTLGAALLGAVAEEAFQATFVDGMAGDAAAVAVARDAVGAGVVILGLYTLVQALRRHQVTRASWLPSLFFLPALLWWVSLSYQGYASQGLGPILSALPAMGAELAIGAVVYGALARLWIARAAGGSAKGSVGDAIVVVGARAQLSSLGFQLMVIPGVWAAISLAFADASAVLAPERPAFSASAELARGVRAKLFKMLTMWLVATLAVTAGVWLWTEPDPANIVNALFLTPTLATPTSRIVSGVVYGLTTWWAVLATTAVYLEREVLRARRDAERAGDAA